MKLVTVSQMQAIEKEADVNGLTYDQMMENAGQGLADIIFDQFEDDVETEIVGLVGPGNNGGDRNRHRNRVRKTCNRKTHCICSR